MLLNLMKIFTLNIYVKTIIPGCCKLAHFVYSTTLIKHKQFQLAKGKTRFWRKELAEYLEREAGCADGTQYISVRPV